MAMLKGKAKGGPRDGVKLECPGNWNGRISVDQYNTHPGHYEFQLSEGTYTWVWIPDPPKETKTPARQRQAFAGYQYRTD